MKHNPSCTLCDLHKDSNPVCMFGRPPRKTPKNRIMVVVDTPNALEGRTRKYLGDLLGLMGIRDDVYLTSVAKCYSDKAKNKHFKACQGYLDEEIDDFNPNIIISMGAGSYRSVVGPGKVTEHRGKAIEKGDRTVLVTLSPAAALVRVQNRAIVEADAKRFREIIESGKIAKPPERKYTVIKTYLDFQAAVSNIVKSKLFVFDLETTTRSPHDENANVNCLGFALDKTEWVLPLDSADSPWRGNYDFQKKLLDILRTAVKGLKVIAHNGKFDNLWMWFKYGWRFKLKFDTMLASHILNENRAHSLKALTTSELNGPNYDISLKEKLGGGSLQKMYQYCALDCYYTRRLYRKFRKQLIDHPSLGKLFLKAVMPLARVFEEMEYEGITIDMDRLDKLAFGDPDATDENQKKQDEKRKGMYRLRAELEAEMAELCQKHSVNWNSSDQVSKILFDDLKLPVIERTDEGKPSSKESVLVELKGRHKLVDLLLEHRRVSKIISGFIEGWKKRVVGNKLFPRYKISGTVTGRCSCEDPNLQQVPRDPVVRSLIGAPPGWTFAQADYSQAELRIAAMNSREKTMLTIFQTGQDIHTKTAIAVSGHDGSKLSGFELKEWRKAAKAVNFGFLYGMGYKKFQQYAKEKYGVEMSLGEAKRTRERFFSLYSGLPAWHDRQRRLVHALGQVRTPTGRVRRLPGVYSEKHDEVSEAERLAINSPVQGFAAELTYAAMVDIARLFTRDELRLIGTVHDSILILVKQGLERLLSVVRAICRRPSLIDELEIELTVPIEIDIETGNWGSGKPYEDEMTEREVRRELKRRIKAAQERELAEAA